MMDRSGFSGWRDMLAMLDSRGLNWSLLLRLGFLVMDGFFLIKSDGIFVMIGLLVMSRLLVMNGLSFVDRLSMVSRLSMMSRLFVVNRSLLLLFFRLSFVFWLLFMSLFLLLIIRGGNILKMSSIGTVMNGRRLDGLRRPMFNDFGLNCCFVMSRHYRLSNKLLVKLLRNFDVFLVASLNCKGCCGRHSNIADGLLSNSIGSRFDVAGLING